MRPLFPLMFAAALVVLAAVAPARAQEDPTAYMLSHIEVLPSAVRQASALLKQLTDASRKEPGVIRFEALRRTVPSSHFLLLEIWKDQAALDAHGTAAASKQFREKIASSSIAPIDDRVAVTTTVDPMQMARARAAKNTITVVTHVDVGPPNRDAAIVALNKLAEASRKEPGNLRFDAIQQKARTNHFFVIEVWKDQKSASAHELTPQAKEFRATFVPLAGALYDQRWYKSL